MHTTHDSELSQRLSTLENDLRELRRMRGFSARSRGSWGGRIALLAATVMASTFAWATDPEPPVPAEQFQPGELIQGKSIYDMFAELYRAVNALETARPVFTNPETGRSYSLDAGYCGATNTTSANVGGQATAKTLCEAACGNSSTAHVCTTRELTRWVETGSEVPVRGFVNNDYSSRYVHEDNWYPRNDCNGWTYAGGSGNVNAVAWNAGAGYPSSGGCGGSLPMLCCD